MVWGLDKESSDGVVMSGETETGNQRKPWKWQTGNYNIQIDLSMAYIKVMGNQNVQINTGKDCCNPLALRGHFTPFQFLCWGILYLYPLRSKLCSCECLGVCGSQSSALWTELRFHIYKRACSLKWWPQDSLKQIIFSFCLQLEFLNKWKFYCGNRFMTFLISYSQRIVLVEKKILI